MRSSLIAVFLLGLSFGLIAQSKTELKEALSEAEKRILVLEERNRSLKKDMALKTNLLNSYRSRLKATQDSLTAFKAAAKNTVNSADVNQVTGEDSLIFIKINGSLNTYKQTSDRWLKGSINREVLEAVMDNISCGNCLKFYSFQSLFTEKAFFEYELVKEGKRFSGIYKYKYVPEFGEVKYTVKAVEGSVLQTSYGRKLVIERIDNETTNIVFEHHLKIPSDSKVHGNGAELQKLYTKEVPLTKMTPESCY